MATFPAVMTAMATPMTPDGALDPDGAQRLASALVDSGSGGLVVAGTTGESPTLDHDETLRLFAAVAEAVGGRTTVIAGCGKNDTAATVNLVREAARLPVDGVMIVAPYYNKPDQRGLAAHFSQVAQATDLPILVYNIPGRTGCEIAPETLLRLAEDHAHIVGVKDAVGDFAKTAWLAARAPGRFSIWSGEDATILPLMAAGGVGVVSVATHVVGPQIADMVARFPSDPLGARRIAFDLAEVCAALFAEPNPAPLKAALTMVGLPAGPVRLPLVDAGEHTVARLRAALAALGAGLMEACDERRAS